MPPWMLEQTKLLPLSPFLKRREPGGPAQHFMVRLQLQWTQSMCANHKHKSVQSLTHQWARLFKGPSRHLPRQSALGWSTMWVPSTTHLINRQLLNNSETLYLKKSIKLFTLQRVVLKVLLKKKKMTSRCLFYSKRPWRQNTSVVHYKDC